MEHVGKQTLVETLTRYNALLEENQLLKDILKENEVRFEEHRLLEQLAFMVCSSLSCENTKGFDPAQLELVSFACEEWRLFKIKHNIVARPRKLNH